MVFIEQEKYKNQFGIYAIKNKINNKVYIGQTSENFQRRYWHHCWKLKQNKHDNCYLQNAFNKYGDENFEFEIIECVTDKSKLNNLEIKYIATYKQDNLCYNMLLGGDGRRGFKMSESTKKKIAEKNKINLLGKTHSKKTKIKMSQTRTGKYYTRHKQTNIINEEIAREIKIQLIDGVSAKEISENLGISYNSVNGILSNNNWSNVIVEGWDEFQTTRNKIKKSTKEEQILIYTEYINGTKKIDLAEKYHKTIKGIEKIIRNVRKTYDNPVPSLNE